MKKWLVLICAVMMLSVACIAVAATESGYNPGEFVYQTNAEDAKRSGDFQYIILNDGTVEIVKYTGRTAMLEIPSKLNGRTVTSIGQYAFDDSEFLTEVIIPDSVTFIAKHAFQGCDLGYISIPGSVISIGEGAFHSCTDAAFLYVSPGVRSIGKAAFQQCSSMMQATLPDTISFIGENAFTSCYSLTDFSIPDSVLEVGGNPFVNCSNLTDIRVSVDHPTLEIIDGILFDKTKKQLVCYPCSLTEKSYNIPKDTQSIACSAFASTTLTSIVIPDSVTSIGDEAFRYCQSLTSIEIPDTVNIVGAGAFRFCKALTSIVIPDSVTSIEVCAFQDCTSLINVVIPDSVTTIEYVAFEGCTALTNVVIPGSVTDIKSNAFRDCPNLTLTVTLGSYAEQYAIDNNIPYICAAEATPAPDAEAGESAPADAFWTCTCGSLNDYNFCPECGQKKPEPTPAPVADGSWTCTCGTVNASKFCPECGAKKPAEPQCQSCGYKPEGTAPKFCPECGTKF